MSLKGKAYIVGAYEHPTRNAVDRSVAQLHADVAWGALADAGLSLADVDGYFCAGDIPGWSAPGVGPFAIEQGLVPAGDDETTVRVIADRHLVNSEALAPEILSFPGTHGFNMLPTSVSTELHALPYCRASDTASYLIG